MAVGVSGFVVRAARNADGNAKATSEATAGISTAHITPAELTALGYLSPPARPVPPYADMYRAAITEADQDVQYVVWAASGGWLTTVESDAFRVNGDPDYITLEPGSLTVGAYSDGTNTVYLRSLNGEGLASVEVTVTRGDTGDEVAVTAASEDLTRGRFTLSSASLIALDGGISEERGDRVSFEYVPAEVTFYWTKNDSQMTRFGWSAAEARWLPLRGTTATSLGVAAEGSTFKVPRPPTRFTVGDVLPGDPLTPDAYALFRAGPYADADSIPLSVLVVADADAVEDGDYPVAGGGYDAVIGATNGILMLNPTWTDDYAGLKVWYNAEAFPSSGNGLLGRMVEFLSLTHHGNPSLSPIPEPTELPLIRIGSRRYLTAIGVENDAALPNPEDFPSGTCYWSWTTGKLVLSADDIHKDVPSFPDYDKAYLGVEVFYDGVSSTRVPVPLTTAAPLLDVNGDPLLGVVAGGAGLTSSRDIYLDRGSPLPAPGISGVQYLPDGTGTYPTTDTPATRPNGSGLVRAIGAGEGDRMFFFKGDERLVEVDDLEYNQDLTGITLRIKQDAIEVARQAADVQPPGATAASYVRLRTAGLTGSALYFREGTLTPCVYEGEARITSRRREPFTFDGGESIRFSVGGSVYTWLASSLPAQETYTAVEVADSLNDVFGSTVASAFRGRIVIADASVSPSVQVLWNADPEDLSGHAALGFLPSWRTDGSDTEYVWLPDSGLHFGLFRTEKNLQGLGDKPDVRATRFLRSYLLTDDIPANPFYTVTAPPLEDLPGFSSSEHFRVAVGRNIVDLGHYEGGQDVAVVYDFKNSRFIWAQEVSLGTTQVLTPTAELALGTPYVFPLSMDSDAIGTGFGLYVREVGSAYAELLLDTDYILPSDGAPGAATLISATGEAISLGNGGVLSGTTFTNPIFSADATRNAEVQMAFWAQVNAGDRLYIENGESRGLYTITATALVSGIATFTVSPAFPANDSGVSWEVFNGAAAGQPDAAVLADVKGVPFDPVGQEVVDIEVLTLIGQAGSTLEAEPRSLMATLGVWLGLSGPTRDLYVLQTTSLGAVAETGLEVPSVLSLHFTTQSFSILIGSYEPTLSVVTSFSPTIPSGTVEVGQSGSGIEGEVRLSADLVADYAGDTVFYKETLLPAASIASGTAELDPESGAVRLRAADAAGYTGTNVYLTEKAIVGTDVVLSPINGSVLFNRPLLAGQLVRASYYSADTAGNQVAEVSEFLPSTVRLETATRVDARTYTFNPGGKTLFSAEGVTVWVGSSLQNFAGQVNMYVDADTSTLSFVADVPVGTVVRVSYLVLEVEGGTTAFTVSSYPVWRPPFFLQVGSGDYIFPGDRSNELEVGQLALVGTVPLYIKAVAVSTDTAATFWPTPIFEVGSRAPAYDAPVQVSDRPVAITIDPDNPVAGGGSTAFLPTLDTGANPYLPGDRGDLTITFLGDVTNYARDRHLIEVGGYPYLIVGATFDGSRTTVNLSSPLYKGHALPEAVRISVRPVYTPEPTLIYGAPHVAGSLTLYRVPTLSPGVRLVEGFDYTVDPASGQITLAEGLPAGSDLVGSWQGIQVLSPTLVGDGASYPSYKAGFYAIATPSEENRLLGSTLLAQYTFAQPDTFFVSVDPLEEYLSTVAEVALQSTATTTGARFPIASGSTDLKTQGSLGYRGTARERVTEDIAARTFIAVYDAIIRYWEQVLELMDGRNIGDRDGKFRFEAPSGRTYPPPGSVDPYTGELNPNLVWREVLEDWAASLGDGYFRVTDPLSLPTTTEEADPVARPGYTDGKTPSPRDLSFFIEQQLRYVINDIDDILLRGLARPRRLAALFPRIDVAGRFAARWRPGPLSRLFPERTRHFTTLLPGIDSTEDGDGAITAAGYYTAGRRVTVSGPRPGQTTKQLVSTNKSAIGSVSNPVLEVIGNITDVSASQRRERARVVAFYPEGDAGLDAALTITTTGKAAWVLSQVSISRFPLDANGYPDGTQLVTGGGEIEDLNTGLAELSVPAWAVGSTLAYGTPSGATFYITDALGYPVFVGEVLAGCVVTVVDVNGNALTGADLYLNGDTLLPSPAMGDTLFAVEPTPDFEQIPDDDEAATVAQSALVAQSVPSYRVGFDVRIDKASGEIKDASLPTRADFFPLPLQSMLGQRPPAPLTTIEGEVEFRNTKRTATEIPALQGQDYDDSGDQQLPYMTPGRSELDVLASIGLRARLLLEADSSAYPYSPLGADADEEQLWGAVYPDEFYTTSGYINEAATSTEDPATLYYDQDLRPVETAGSYTAGSAIGDVRKYDILFVEVGQPGINATGVIQVGAATSETIEPARFVSPAMLGDIHKYSAHNVWGHLSGNFPATSGIYSTTSFGGVFWTTVLDLSSIGGLVLDSGGTLAGGLLALVGAGSPGGAAVIRFFNPDPNLVGTALVGALVFPNQSAAGTFYAYNAGTATVTALTLAAGGLSYSASNILTFNSLGANPLTLIGVTAATYYDVAIGIDTYWDTLTSLLTGAALTVGSGPGSTSCFVGRDRLTFGERISFAKALPRESYPANGDVIDLGVRLSVWEITTSGVADCSVNAPAEVNGGDAFTCLTRVGPSPDGTVAAGVEYVGTFTPGAAGSEQGLLKVMGWEGAGNTPLSGYSGGVLSGVIASAVPSSDLNASSQILNGVGVCYDSVGPALVTVEGSRCWVQEIGVNQGAIDRVMPGDVLVIDSGAGGFSEGSSKAGTYLVRHAIETNATASSGNPVYAAVVYADAGGRRSLDLRFPTVKSISGTTLVLEEVVAVPHSSSGCPFPDPAVTLSVEWVYLILKNKYAEYDGASYTVEGSAVYRAGYSALLFDQTTNEVTLTLNGSYQDATGAALSAATFAAAAAAGTPVSGMLYLPLNPATATTTLAANNNVGERADTIGTELTAGVKLACLGNLNSAVHGSTTVTGMYWDKSAALADIERLLNDGDAPSASKLGVRVPSPEDSADFYEDRSTAVYGRRYATGSTAEEAVSGVLAHVDVSSLSASDWTDVHFDSGSGIVAGDHRLYCLLPGDRFVFGDDLDPTASNEGLFLLSGIFLEPSWPRPVQDLIGTAAVSASHSLTPAQVGMRDAADFTASAVVSEDVHFYVRRIRRFHEDVTVLAQDFSALKPLYELRRGAFDSYNYATRVLTADPTLYGAATSVGDFDDDAVNINGGDEVRVYAGTTLLATATVGKVLSATEIRLRRPGFVGLLVGADRFEVYLAQRPVPLEQSVNQLLEAITESVVLERTVVYTDGDTQGGSASGFNTMQDDLITDWEAEGVAEGQWVVVGPGGNLYQTGEVADRPAGDNAVVGRAGYLAGSPGRFDDNRGAYQVTSVDGADLFVSGAIDRWAGAAADGSDDEILGGAGAEYVGLPTVHGSTLTATDPAYPFLGREGQAALRPTAPPPTPGGSYTDRTGFDQYKSIAPFGYKIISPVTWLSDDAVGLVLYHRERALSWIGEVRSLYDSEKGGDYYTFQATDGIEQLYRALVYNADITGLVGNLGVTPFTNTADALSLLDRRFWAGDTRLDPLGYSDFLTDSLEQLPVWPDRIEETLSTSDDLRGLRFAWIRYRTDLINGSLTRAERAREDAAEAESAAKAATKTAKTLRG